MSAKPKREPSPEEATIRRKFLRKLAEMVQKARRRQAR
jgi:hypothetical protein